MKEIGGYFGLELNERGHYHSNLDALYVNSGRHALEHLLKSIQAKKIYLPAYNCNVLLEAVDRANVDYVIYNVQANLEPNLDFSVLQKDDYVVVTNYFGMMDDYIDQLVAKHKNIIVDCAQSFYYFPKSYLANNYFFYSPRKFFGVSDGGILFPAIGQGDDYLRDVSIQRMEHLLVRRDLDAGRGYAKFQDNDGELSLEPIKLMSKLTQDILRSIDYEQIREKRLANYLYLENELGKLNEFQLHRSGVPMVYAFLGSKDLRAYLIQHKVYVAQYWPNILGAQSLNATEKSLSENLLALPIDQRYDIEDMKFIVTLVKQFFD